MMKLLNFPDDRTKEAEAADRAPRTPATHEREPAAARIRSETQHRVSLSNDY